MGSIKLNGQELEQVSSFGFTGGSSFKMTFKVYPGNENTDLTYIGQEAAGQKWVSVEVESEDFNFSTDQCRLMRYEVTPEDYQGTFDKVTTEFAIFIRQGAME